MGCETTSSGRLRVWLLAGSMVLVLASCSATDGLFGNEVDDTIRSEASREASTEGAAEVEADAEAGQPDGVEVEAEAVSERPSIWVRGDDAAMRPTSPRATVRDVIAPGNGHGWTLVGSIFDYSTGTSQPVVWTADERLSRSSWTRVDVQEAADGDAQMVGAARADGMDVAVGSHSDGQDRRPAVWLRSAGSEWRSVGRSQFDRHAPEWLSHVAVAASGDLMIAVGGQRHAKGETRPIVWLSVDGEVWEAVEDLPFSTDGTQDLRGLAVGPNASVLTGQQSDSTTAAIAFWSEDGRRWTKAEVEAPADGGRSYMGESTWFNDRFVAVGGVATGDVFRPASWVSTDGKVWELQKAAFETMDDGRTVNVGFGAWRATSTDSKLYASSRSSFLQQLWQSSDGKTWKVVGDITDVRSQNLTVNSIAAVDDQIVFATGEPGVVIYEGEYTQAPLTSTLLPVPDNHPWVSDIGHHHGSWVAVGGSSVQRADGGSAETATLWRSADGVDWELAERLPEVSAGSVNAVASLPGGLVAVGTESTRSAALRRRPGRGLIWKFSASDWEELDAPSASEDGVRIGLDEVASIGGSLLVGGWRFDPTGDDSDALLIEENEDGVLERVDIGHRGPDNELLVGLCSNEAGDAVAIVSTQQPDANQLTAVRRSPDRRWVDASWPAAARDERAGVAGCVHGVDGFLAAGVTSTGGTDRNVGLWRSADGSIWERLDGPPAFSAPGEQAVHSVVAAEDGYLMAGHDASTGVARPVVWYGSGDDWDQVVISNAGNMGSLEIGYAAGVVVVTGWNDGAVQAYSTTLEQLLVELDR